MRFFCIAVLLFLSVGKVRAEESRTNYTDCNSVKEPLVKNSPKFGASFTDVVKGLESAFELAIVKNTFAQLVYIKPFSHIKYVFSEDKLTEYSWVYSEEFMEDFSGNLENVLESCVKRVTGMYGPAHKASQLAHEWSFGGLKIVLLLDKSEGVVSLNYTCKLKPSEKKEN